MKQIIPVIRSFDETQAKEFYIHFLNFCLDWEHRFEEGLPLYFQVSKGNCILHISEHEGDCVPGARIRIEVDDLESFHEHLIKKKYSHSKPTNIIEQTWGLYEMELKDPFENTITFYSKV